MLPAALPGAAGAATPVLQAVGTARNGVGTVAWPAHQVDDVALLFVESAGGEAVTLSVPNGFSPVANSPQFTGAGTAGTRISVFWARATSAGMTGPTIAGPVDHVYSVIITFRGVVRNGNPVEASAGGVKTPASVSVTAGGVTTTVEETLLALGVANDLDASKAVASAWANGALGGIAEVFDAAINTGGGGGLSVMVATPTAEGATGNTTLTVTSSINAYLTIALKRLTPPRINTLTVDARQLSAGWPLLSGATGYTLVASKTQSIPPDLTYSSETVTGSAQVNAPALDANTTYYLYIRSNGARENSEWKFYRDTATLVEFQPATPDFGTVSAGAIQFTWSNNGNPVTGSPNPAGYRVLVSTAPDPLFPNGAVVTTSNTFNVSLTTSGLAANTTYYFRVASVNHNGVITNNFYTTAIGTSTLLAAAPAFNAFTVSTGSVRLDWLHNGNRNGTLYRVLVSSMSSFVPAASSDTYNTFLSSAGLAANTTYYFRVYGVNNNGVTIGPLEVSTATLARAAVFTDFVDLSTGSLRLRWSANGNPADTLYRVLVSSMASFVPAASSDTYNTWLGTAGVQPNTTFYFSVTGVNRNGVSTTSLAASLATWAQPAAFTDFVDLSTGSARLRWNGDRNPADTLYRVRVSSLSDLSVYTSSDTYNAWLSTAGVLPNTTYYFSVTGVNRNGAAAAPLAASTATWARPALPSGFTQTSESALRLDWDPNGNPGGTLYRVKVSTAQNPDAPGGAVATSSETYNTWLSSSGLAANVTYYFIASAVNRNAVPTGYSAAFSTSTLAYPPSGLVLSGISPVFMQLDWSDSGNRPGTLYRVRSSTAANLDAPAGAPVVSSFTYNTFLSTAGLIPATQYYFEALAINNNGVATARAYENAPTLAIGQLGAPVPGDVTGVFITSAAANWSLVSGATGYTLAASLLPDVPPAVADSSTTHTGENSAELKALLPDTQYYLFVRANGLLASSEWSAFPAVYTRVEFAPFFTAFSGVQENSAAFAWDRNGNPYPSTAYRVLVSTAPDPRLPAGAVVSSSDTYNVSLSSSGLAANTTYYFRVAGLNKDGVTTAYTAPVSTVTRAGEPVPAGFYSVGASGIEFRWTGINPAGTLYRVKVSTSSSFSGGAVVTSSETYNRYLSSSGLAANTTYYFSAAAVDHGGLATGYSPAASTATLLAADPAFDRFVTDTAGTIEFRWTPAGPGNTLYRVLSSTADTSSPGGAVVLSSYTYNTWLSSSGLAANTTYYFNASGLNHNGVPTLYTGVKSTASLANLPASVLSTFSAVGVSGFTASWAANGNPPGTLYAVNVSTAQDFNAGAADQASASTRPASGLSYGFAGLTSDAVYYFRVRAVNHNGVSTDPAVLGSTSTLALAAPAADPVTEVWTSSITASWQLVAGATGYTLAASVNEGAPPSPVYSSSVTAAASASVYEPALGFNTTYYLFVRANGPRRSGPWTAYPATSTLANVPLSAVSTFSAVQFNSLAVSWDANSNALASTVYTVQLSSAQDFNEGVTDGVSFDTAPVYGPGAFFEGLNADTYYYFRVRARHNNGNYTPWKELGYAKTKALPEIHAAGDGVLLYGQAGNSAPQFRRYSSASNTFGGAVNSLQGAPGSLFVIKTFPLETRQEALAGYVKDGTLHLLCTDGANWYEEWTQPVGGKETTRRFDIAYEPNTGDALVLYSRGVASSGELGYRTRPGSYECGAGGWSADTPFSPAATSGTVLWVKLAPDSRASSGTIAAAWSDDASDLGAMVWSGSAWQSETVSPLATTLDFVTAAGDTEVFDLAYDSVGGIMVVWGLAVAANNNGAYYSSATWSEAAQSHTWNAVTAMPVFADDATNLDLAANPASNEMVFASIGKNGSDLQAGYWNGTAWANTANKDTAAGAPLAGTRLVAAAWVSSGSVTRSVVVYNDQGTTGINYFTGTAGTFSNVTAVSPAPVFGTPQKLYAMLQDPVKRDRLMLTVSDVNSDLFAKRLVMNTAGTITWSDAAGGAALETSLASTTVAGHSFSFWPAPPVTVYAQSSSRFFANQVSAAVGAPLAEQDALAPLSAAAEPFRLRMTLHVSQVNLPAGGESFKLQFAGKGTGSCEAPSGGTPDVYTDVTGLTAVAFADNASVADGAALSPSADDPAHGAHVIVDQTYEELSPVPVSAAIQRNQDGLWDFALKENGVTPGEIYCFRLVKTDGSPLESYDKFPEAILPAPVRVNEVYPGGAAGGDWVELYNATSSTYSLAGWKLYYVASTIDLGGSLVPLWNGSAGQEINAFSTYTLGGFADDLAGGSRGHVILHDAFANRLDIVEWPALSSGQSFARIVDGGAFFEIDPTPTRNYANFTGTGGFKLSEVSAGALESQFMELYSVQGQAVTLSSYSLRNVASSESGLVFRFDRKIYPSDYALLDFSSVSREGRTFTGVFGPSGLSAAGDFLTLEDSSGSTVNTLTWQSDGNYHRYNYRGSTVPYTGGLGVSPSGVMARSSLAGYDAGDSSALFSFASFPTAASRNDNAGTALANRLLYPPEQAEPQHLSRKFPLTLDLNSAASGAGNNLVFTRLPGGSADAYSPHLYRLADLGFNLAYIDTQTVTQYGFSFYDQDGRPLVSSATYRVTLNSGGASASAPQVVLPSVTYDASVHAVAGSTAAPLWMNDASRAAMLRLDVGNSSPAGFNQLLLATATFRLLDSSLQPLTQGAARSIFDAVMLAADSLTAGTTGIYEPNIDLSTVAYVPMGAITLDSQGVSTLTVDTGLSGAQVPAGSTRTFFVVFESTRDASASAPTGGFRVRFDPAYPAGLIDQAGGLAQDLSATAQADGPAVTLISPAQPPSGTAWPYVSPASAPVYSAASVYSGPALAGARTYVTSTDGSLSALSAAGGLIWSFPTGSPVYTSPSEPQDEGGSVYIYFANDNGDVYKVKDEGSSASAAWASPYHVPAAKIRSSLILYGSRIYFGADDNKMHCVMRDKSACSLWNDIAVPGVVSATPAVDDRNGVNAAWVGTEDGSIVFVQTGDNGVASSYPTGMSIKSSPFVDAGLGSSLNKLFIASTDGNLYTSSLLLTGVEAVFPAGAAIRTSPFVWPFGGKKYVFFGDDAGRMHMVSTATWTEPAGWPFQAGGPIRSSPVVVPAGFIPGLPAGEDYVYFGCDDGYIYGVNVNTGVRRQGWPVATGGPVRADPATDIDSDTGKYNLVVGSTDGRTYTLKIGPP
jgi:hypothetical protein